MLRQGVKDVSGSECLKACLAGANNLYRVTASLVCQCISLSSHLRPVVNRPTGGSSETCRGASRRDGVSLTSPKAAAPATADMPKSYTKRIVDRQNHTHLARIIVVDGFPVFWSHIPAQPVEKYVLRSGSLLGA